MFDTGRYELSDSSSKVLSSRAIAPLVASAQGLFDIDSGTLKTALQRLAFPEPHTSRSAEAKHLSSTSSMGALGMPWYRPDDVVAYARARAEGHVETLPVPMFGQWRPSVAGTGPKYLMRKGSVLPLGVHPSTPKEWLSAPAEILLAEGLFKGLAALTAHLRENGISDEILGQWMPLERAIPELHKVMDSLDPERRLLVVNLVSVTTWKGRSDWGDLPIRGNDVRVCFDADVASNPNVWVQAEALWSSLLDRKASPSLIHPSAPGMPTAGLDDALAAGARLCDLLASASPSLPPSPGMAVRDGDLRVDDKRACVEKASVNDETGMPTWAPIVPLGGRIISVDTRRAPTPEEMLSGQAMRLQQDSLEAQDVEIEVSWLDDAGQVSTSSITGPIRLLSEDPRGWSRLPEVYVPSEIQLLPQWPPPPQWLQAIKKNHEDQREDTMTWMVMGWVPTETSPVFIAGRDVIGPDGPSEHTRPGVTSADQLNAATDFGLELPESNEQLRAEIEYVLDLYNEHAAWMNPAIPAIVFAAGLRPCVPLRTQATIALAGPPNAGKSWTISRMMSFWQSSPGAFSSNLPGSAEDSIASTEQSLARSFIWVLDDAAAQATRQKSEQVIENVNQAIRTTFNGTGRGRSTIDGRQRHRSNPRALLVVSAENFTGVESIQQRTALINVVRGEFLSADRTPTQNIVNHERSSMANNHIAAATVRMVARHAADTSWGECLRSWRLRLQDARTGAESVIRTVSAQSDRGADVAADLALGLEALGDLAEMVGVSDYHRDMIDDMREKLFTHIAVMWRDQNEQSGGRRLLNALSDMLGSGEISIASAGSSEPPLHDLDTSSPYAPYRPAIQQRLGWQPAYGAVPAQVRSRDKTAGVLVMAGDEPCVLFNAATAFKYAAASRTELVSPGQRSNETWSQVWSEGLPSTHWKRRPGGSGRPRVTVRVMVNDISYEGVPIPLWKLFGWESDTVPSGLRAQLESIQNTEVAR